MVEGFVAPVGEHTAFRSTGTTGGFQASGGEETPVAVGSWVTPEELLADPRPGEHVVWKSDIDGFDLHVLHDHWELIDAACDTLWFEFDPVGALGRAEDVEELVDQLAGSGRRVDVYDNLGRLMVRLPPGPAVGQGLTALTAWLKEQRLGHLTVPYLDLWAYRS